MIKHILVTLVLVIGLSGLGNAVYTCTEDYDMNGTGSFIYPNHGWLYLTSSDHATVYNTWCVANKSYTGMPEGGKLYIEGCGAMEGRNCNLYDPYSEHINHAKYYSGGWHYIRPVGFLNVPFASAYPSYSGSISAIATPQVGSQYVIFECGSDINSGETQYMDAYLTVYVSPTMINNYTISGNIECIDNVSIYTYINNTYVYSGINSTDYYQFKIIDNESYKLIFSDAHEYEFTVDGSDIIYDHDACSHTQYRFEESCGNLIPDSEGTFTEYDGFWATIWDFYAPSGIFDISNSSATKIAIHSHTFIGDTGWVIDPVVTDSEYTLLNPNIAWGLKVIVQNESDGELIDGAMVKVDQTCYCTNGYSTRQKLTVNGMTQFGDMSLQDASLFVMKTGYKILKENSTGYDVFLSGRSNFSSKTWIVKLANSSSNNSSSFYEVNNTVDIHFVDITGNRTSKILDTDASVDLYYENNNTEEEAMTLKFQSSSTHTYFIDEQSWTIAYDDIGHKTIANSYFTPWDYSYRAVIYNSSIYGWNITIPLTVRNGTRQEEQHYQNLTTNLWFMYASDGKVDYRDALKVAIHARSNNTTLMTTDIELWKDGVYIACKNLTATDYAGADLPYYYVWNPVFDYITGSNYSVRMYGFDRMLLETDYVICESDDTTRKNKLTIGVKNRAGGNLNNCYIYLEDWGSLPTGSVYYNSYEGIDNGDYRYKATKAGYSGSGWETVNLTDEDKIVWYVLSEDYTNTSIAATKFTDDDIKGFFFPLMFFLLICIVLGGLKYVAS